MQDDDDDDDGDDGDGDKDVDMDGGTDGWKKEYLQWWFDFLDERGGKGITKDTWIMVCNYFQHQLTFIVLRLRITFIYSWHSIIKFFAFIRSIDANFSNYNADGV